MNAPILGTITEQQIEDEVRDKGLTAPRITPAQINAKIRSAQYYVFPGTTLTVCCLTLANGYHVTGQSAAASLVNFDEELGRKIAAADAREKIWALEGYLLREQLTGDPRQRLAEGMQAGAPYSGPAQHTYTAGCDGFHEPGQCPRST